MGHVLFTHTNPALPMFMIGSYLTLVISKTTSIIKLANVLTITLWSGSITILEPCIPLSDSSLGSESEEVRQEVKAIEVGQ